MTNVGSPSGTAATISATHTVNAVFTGSIDSKNGIIPDASILSTFFITIFTIIKINSNPARAPDILVIFPPKSPSLT